MFSHVATCTLCLGLMILAACHAPKRSSQLQSQISQETEFPAFLWASKTIRVCWVNPEAGEPYRKLIQETSIREFARIGFQLDQGWSACTSEEMEQFPRSPLIRIRFDTTAPAPFGGATAVGAVQGLLSDVTLRADPKTHVDPYCQQNPEICEQFWALHEIGHSFGLEHSHQHPMAQDKGQYLYPMPIHRSNTDHAFRTVNYLGAFDPMSVMSYSVAPSTTELFAADIRTLKALYQQPTILIQGPSAQLNGRRIKQLQLRLSSLRFPETTNYSAERPTHYQYKIVPIEESCDSADGYSPRQELDRSIEADLSKIFPEGTNVKICVVGSNAQVTQDFKAHTSLYWQVGFDKARDFDFRGLVHLDQCSGALVRFEKSDPQDFAMALTNAHCVGLEPGQVIKDEATENYIYPLDQKGGSRYFQGDDALKADKILYATLGVTDIALLRLDKRYQDLSQYTFYTLAQEQPREQTAIDVLSSFFSEGFSCSLEHIAERLIEGEATFLKPMRYSAGCKLFPGTSGSPVLDRKTQKIIGINATGNDQGERCTPSNPCEEEADGKIVYQKSYGYALQTALIYDCLNAKGEIETSLPGCLLPKGK